MRARRGPPDIAGQKIFVPDAVPIGSGGAHMEQHAMLKPMPSDFADPAESSTETVARALAALTPSDLLRLKRVAQLRARLIPGLEWDELLNEALLRALDGSRRWPEGVPLLAFIAGIMRSLVDGRAQERRRLVERALAVGQTPAAPAPDARLHARQCLAAIAKFFAGDPDVLALIAALAQQHLGCVDNPAPRLGKKRREAARKRLARAILRGQLDGFLP
jgi:DNA-directed RNA polymerase specialized sigma24 family protein